MPAIDVRLETFDPGVHSSILRDWLRKPHVARWWGDPKAALKTSMGHSNETRAVITVNGEPVGFLCWQKLSLSELADAGLSDLPADLVDIDILIGETEFLGRGIGPRALALLLAKLRSEGVGYAGLGTSASNRAAIAAFEKAGFRQFRDFEDPEFGSCIYLVAQVDKDVED